MADYLHHYKVHLTVTGNERAFSAITTNAVRGKNHRISVNGNLNKFPFLITLLHELAHLLTHEKYGHRVASHNKEWKAIYGQLLSAFYKHNIFPLDIETELQRSLVNPAASSCAEEHLMRVLRRYDVKKMFSHSRRNYNRRHFHYQRRRHFKSERLRKRYRYYRNKTGLVYLFSALYEVRIAG